MDKIFKAFYDDDLGEIILKENPLITAKKQEVEFRINNRYEQKGFWKSIIDNWEDEGLI